MSRLQVGEPHAPDSSLATSTQPCVTQRIRPPLSCQESWKTVQIALKSTEKLPVSQYLDNFSPLHATTPPPQKPLAEAWHWLESHSQIQTFKQTTVQILTSPGSWEHNPDPLDVRRDPVSGGRDELGLQNVLRHWVDQRSPPAPSWVHSLALSPPWPSPREKKQFLPLRVTSASVGHKTKAVWLFRIFTGPEHHLLFSLVKADDGSSRKNSFESCSRSQIRLPGKRKRSGSYYYSKSLIWIFLEKKIKHLLCHRCQQSINSVS